MTLKRVFLLFSTVLFISVACAQETRTIDPYTRSNKVWTSLGIRYKQGDNTFKIAEYARFEGQMPTQQVFTELSAKRKFTKWFSAAAAWRLYSIGKENHRLDAEILLSKRLSIFSLENRVRTTYGTARKQNYLRNKLEVEVYKKKTYISKKGKEKKRKPKLIPSASAEWFYRLNGINETDKYRLTTGIGWEISDLLKIKAFGRYQQEINVNYPEKAFIIGTNLTIRL